MWLFDLLFSSIPQIWYVEVRISRSIPESPFEITRVDCSSILFHFFLPVSKVRFVAINVTSQNV